MERLDQLDTVQHPVDRAGGRQHQRVARAPFAAMEPSCRCSFDVGVSANQPLDGLLSFSSKAATHVHEFLRHHSEGPLYVVVGYASVWGLAWLQEHTLGRPVTLIIGDTKEYRFKSATDSDWEEAWELINRCDVEVLGWYRSPRSARGESMLHAKAWVVVDRSRTKAEAALVGSANLTKMGMQDNWEMMTVAVETDLPRIWAQLDGFVQGKTEKKPWPAEKLRKAITAGLTSSR
ncbi:MAG: phospholipase D family protein [bacterium]|nr:phospholipase D family protein [bacterium]